MYEVTRPQPTADAIYDAANRAVEGYRHLAANTGITTIYACECGHGGYVIDSLAGSSDVDSLKSVIEHSAFDHPTRWRVLFTQTVGAIEVWSD